MTPESLGRVARGLRGFGAPEAWAVRVEIRAQEATVTFAVTAGQLALQAPMLADELAGEVERRRAFFERIHQEAGFCQASDWSPIAAAMESVTADLQHGRIP